MKLPNSICYKKENVMSEVQTCWICGVTGMEDHKCFDLDIPEVPEIEGKGTFKCAMSSCNNTVVDTFDGDYCTPCWTRIENASLFGYYTQKDEEAGIWFEEQKEIPIHDGISNWKEWHETTAIRAYLLWLYSDQTKSDTFYWLRAEHGIYDLGYCPTCMLQGFHDQF